MLRGKASKLREGDILLLHGDADKFFSFKDKFGLEIQKREAIDDIQLSSEDVSLVEA